MGCCISTARIHSSDPAADSVPMTPSVIVSPQPVAEEPSATLSRPRQCSRISPAHELTHELTPEKQMTSYHSKSIRGVMSSPPQSPHWVNCCVTDPGHQTTGARVLTSLVREVLTNYKFRILVVGKKGSGKSSLINTAFKVDILAVPGKLSRRPDINHEIHPKENRYLIVHEYSGFEPGDGQGLQAIRDFISCRTNPSCADAEKLHAIWICIPTSDGLNKNIGEGVEEILSMERVPVVAAFTKFDVVILVESGKVQTHDQARNNAYTRYEQSCRFLFRKNPKDVPAEIVQVKSRLGDLIDNLVVTTDRLIKGLPTAPISSPSSSVQRVRPRISPVYLAWSAALRACPDVIIEASIEVGQSRYWRNLQSSLDFVDQTLEHCMNVLHVDIVEIWNLNDGDNYLSSTSFKIKMSYVVKDLAEMPGGVLKRPDPSRSGDKFAEWVDGVYRESREDVQCLMGYIVDLTVILDDIFKTSAGYVSADDAQWAMDKHLRSQTGRKDKIHRDIRHFVKELFGTRNTVSQRDIVLEKIMELIRHYCGLPSSRYG